MVQSRLLNLKVSSFWLVLSPWLWQIQVTNMTPFYFLSYGAKTYGKKGKKNLGFQIMYLTHTRRLKTKKWVWTEKPKKEVRKVKRKVFLYPVRDATLKKSWSEPRIITFCPNWQLNEIFGSLLEWAKSGRWGWGVMGGDMYWSMCCLQV